MQCRPFGSRGALPNTPVKQTRQPVSGENGCFLQGQDHLPLCWFHQFVLALWPNCLSWQNGSGPNQATCVGRKWVFLAGSPSNALVSPICSHVVTKLSVVAERQWTKPGKLRREKIVGVSCRITFHRVGFTNLFSTLPVGLCVCLHHTEFGTALLINPKGQAERTFTVKLCFPHNSHKTKRQAVVTA